MSYFCSQSMLTNSPDPCSSSRQAIKKCSYCVSPCTQALVFFEVLERFLQPVLQAPFTDMMKHWYVFHKGRKKKKLCSPTFSSIPMQVGPLPQYLEQGQASQPHHIAGYPSLHSLPFLLQKKREK